MKNILQNMFAFCVAGLSVVALLAISLSILTALYTLAIAAALNVAHYLGWLWF